MTSNNKLQKLRRSLGLTIGELSDQEDVQSSTIATLENNGGVYSEKPRAMRMLIRLGIPYKINHRGSIVVDNIAVLSKPAEGCLDVAYLGQYYDDAYLGNGLSQSSDGDVFYNELKDAFSQSSLTMDEISEKYEIPVPKLVDLSSGRRFLDYHPETVDMLDDLNVKYAYNDDSSLYVRRHFRVKDDDALARMMADSSYLKRLQFFSPDEETVTKTINDFEIRYPESSVSADNSIVETPSKLVSESLAVPEVEVLAEDLLSDLSKSLKNILATYDWNDNDSDALKEAYKVIGMRILEEELSVI